MFVHSLWALTSLPLADTSGRLSDELGEFERIELHPGFMLSRPVRNVILESDDGWTKSSHSNVVDNLLAVYLLNPRSSGLPPDTGTVVGAVSALPELNSTIIAGVVASTEGHMITPDLSRSKLSDLDIYEARIVDDQAERSITYSDPQWAAFRFDSDWGSTEALTAATVLFGRTSLLTVFSDGQIWLQGVSPESVPEAITKTVGKLWPRE